MKHRKGHKGHWKNKRNPYKDLLNKMPYMDENAVRAKIQGFFKTIIIVSSIFSAIFYALMQGIQIYCIKKCMKAQKVLEDKYMGPEIVAVQPTQRQVAAASTETAQQPVIQYIVQPPQTAPAATGTIVSANQIV